MTAVAVAGDALPQELVRRAQRRLVRPVPADLVWGWLIPLGITAIGTIMRFWDITRPKAKVFDETYYAHDAYNLLHHGVELDPSHHDKAPGFVVHPPLGKWMIAAGEWMFGNHPLGWRFSAAVVGSLSILMIARIARRLFRSNVLGCVAALLLSFDALEFVQSRTSMLDIFLMFWVLAAFGCLLIDRDAGRRKLSELIDGTSAQVGAARFLGIRPWRWATGFCLGCAAATKWNGAVWIPAFFVLALWWDAGARRVAGAQRPIRSAFLRDGPVLVASFVVLAVIVYAVSWTGWFLSDAAHAYGHDRYVHHGQSWFSHDRAVLGGWLRYHWEIYRFHTTLAAAHPYLSNPLGWLLLARPVAYYYATPHTCGAASCSQEVLGIGTPAIWWLSIPALVVVTWRMLIKRDWRAAAIIVVFATGYLTWIFDEAQTVPNCHPAGDCHRTMFLFYLLPDVPFMVLALTMCLGLILGKRTSGLARRVTAAVVAGVYLSGVIWNFGYLYPVLAAKTITYNQWQDRMWLDVCDTNPKRDQHHESAPCWI